MAACARNFAIMPALCSMLLNAHYAQNYASIIGTSLPMVDVATDLLSISFVSLF